MGRIILLLVLSILFHRSCAELIASLPGQHFRVSFKQYSGYIVTNAKHGRALFYYFVEAETPNPLAKPLTLWLNGGPGCSSLGFGAFFEHGPFRPRNDGYLIKNKYSWNLESNMLYVESPIGVGFSYSNTSSDYTNWNDTQTAQDNLQFIINWFKEFPKYRDLELHLTGESYAGHYIPQLAALLLEYNNQPNVKPIKLKSIALGNPLLDIEISVDNAEYLWSHGVISDEMLMLKRTVCNESRSVLESIHRNVSKECSYVQEKFIKEIGQSIDLGDVIKPICLSPSVTRQSNYKGMHSIKQAKFGGETAGSDVCLEDNILAYLNDHQVQKALHANTTHLPYPWDFCLGPLDYQFDNLGLNIIPLLSELIRKRVSILLYSGDQDSKVPLTQTRIIANELAQDLKLVALSGYVPWNDNMQVAGWTKSFGKLRAGKNMTYLTFATVRGGAHEVPSTSPSQALALFRAFVKGSSL